MSAEDMPDIIWAVDANGKRLGWGRWNYDKPGVYERVQRECFDAHCAAHPVTSSLGLRVRMAQTIRFEDQLAKELAEQKEPV